MLVNLNCILFHNQNDGWALSKPYFRVCCKNIYLRILFLKKTKLLDKNCHVFFWVVIPHRLKFKCQRFGTLCLFHLHRRVGMKCDSG
jgi:hypothetical protein